MVDIIRKKIVEVQKKEQDVIYEKVTEKIETFTVEQIDDEINNLQARIDELNEKKNTALAIK